MWVFSFSVLLFFFFLLKFLVFVDSFLVYFAFEWTKFLLRPLHLVRYTVKLARANLLAMAAGKVFRWWNYLRMRAKISAGNDCLRFPQVTGGNLTAPEGYLHEAFIVRVTADFIESKNAFFYPVPNNLTKVTICCLWSQWKNLPNRFCSEKDDRSLLAAQCVIQNITARWKFLRYRQKDRKLAVVSFSLFSHLSSEGKKSSKSNIRFSISLETQCTLDEM